jgi:head-tail adaptor
MATRGQKRHLVSLENPGGQVPDGDGGYTEVGVALQPPQMYAEIKPATVRDMERVFAGTVQSTASHMVTMDYHPQVTTKTRLWFGTRLFAITSVQNPEERNLELVLSCEEVVA